MANQQEIINIPTEEEWEAFRLYEVRINEKIEKIRKGESP